MSAPRIIPARLGLLVSALVVAPGALTGQAEVPQKLARMAWLAGCWHGESGNRVVEEHWFSPRGGTMLGSARATRDDRTTSVELTVLRMAGDTLVYHAYPVGQSPTVFPAVALADDSVVFANPEHDFPKRIIYRRVGADSIHARVEGPLNGRETSVHYAMRRVRCPGPP